MSLYAVKNDEGKWLGCEIYCDEPDWFDHGGFIWDTRSIAEKNVKLYGGHISELVDSPAKVVVSEEEDKVLKKAKNTTVWRPAAVISDYAYNAVKDSDQEALLEDRLMRAYVIGWTVEKLKRYLLPMPDGTSDELDQGKYVAIRETGGIWHGSEHRHDITKQAELEYFFVTQSDIDTAPDWVKAITPVEVTDDEV